MTTHSLAQIGVNTEAEARNARAEVEVQAGKPVAAGGPSDHFVERNGLRYAGSHLIIDLWDGEHLDDVGVIELALRRAVQAAGATLLHLHLHEFGSGGGVSGVAVLAELHISIHTWPERGYAAIDVFMCGVGRAAQGRAGAATCVQGAPDRHLRADARRLVMSEWYEEAYHPHWRQRFEVERVRLPGTHRAPGGDHLRARRSSDGSWCSTASCRPPSATSSSITR